MITLQKATDRSKIILEKSVGEIIATARWTDNGDSSGDNDDLDLKAGILFPNGKMSIVHCVHPGSLQEAPFVKHLGDVKTASKDNPGEEIIKVSTDISMKYNGHVAIVFSVYSAISNGPVAIASLHPVMRLQYKDQIVDCALDFSKDQKALQKHVYTYVIGIATIRGHEVEITPGGMVSSPGSEATPWLTWNQNGDPSVTMDGPAVMKSGGKLLAGIMNMGNQKKYEIVQVNSISNQAALSDRQLSQIEDLKQAHAQGFLSTEDLNKKIEAITRS